MIRTALPEVTGGALTLPAGCSAITYFLVHSIL